MHEIKCKKAKKLSQNGKFHRTFAILWNCVPEEIRASCTAKQLAQIIDAMRLVHLSGIALRED